MKKIFYLILTVLFLLPIAVKADMGAPYIKAYKVVSKTGNEIPYYDWSFKEAGKLPGNFEVDIMNEIKKDGEVYGDFTTTEYAGYVKLSDVKLVGAQETSEKEAKYKAVIFAEEGLTVYAGPNYLTGEVGQVSYKDEVTAADYEEGNAWIYIEKGNVKGYVDGLHGSIGILTKGDRIDVNTSTKYTEYYSLDSWSRNAIYIKEGENYTKIENTASTFDMKEVTVLNECKVYKDGDWSSDGTNISLGDVIGTIPKGTVIKPAYTNSRYDVISLYVETSSISGWIKGNSKDFSANCFSLTGESTAVTSTEDSTSTETIGAISTEVYVTDVAIEDVGDKKNGSKFTTKEIVIGSICLGAIIVLTAVVTIVLVNKKKKVTVAEQTVPETNNTNE